MAKFAPTEQDVEEVIACLKTASKKQDAYNLLSLFGKVSGEKPIVWYPGIIGFGHYQYKQSSGREGQSPLLAFAPRQAKISLYIDQNLPNRDQLLSQLGKHKLAVGCVYVNKLADIDLAVLEEILLATLEHVKSKQIN